MLDWRSRKRINKHKKRTSTPIRVALNGSHPPDTMQTRSDGLERR